MIKSNIKLIDLNKEQAKEIQRLLNISVDGIVGPETLKTFSEWKKRNYLTNLDIIGPNSYELLLNQKSNNNYNLEIIKEFEGYNSIAYRCPAGIPTIGYGTTVYSNGSKVKYGDTITKEKAEYELLDYINKRIIPQLEKIPHWDEMNYNQKSALISFAYNLGEHFYGNPNFKSISKVLREKNWNIVPETLLLYRNPGSQFEEGLRRRRIAEGNLWKL